MKWDRRGHSRSRCSARSSRKCSSKDATLAYGDAEVDKPWAVTLKFKANGAVDVKGEFTTGIDAKDQPVVYLASGSATLIPETEPDEVTGAFEGKVVVYLAPNAKKNFEGYYGEISVAWDGEKFIMR